ncbi:MAG: transposase [Candidatus Paceibacterota bacterium]
MRKEPYGVGSIVHVIKRGARGLEIVQDPGDRWRFLLMLRHLNDKHQPKDWFRDILREDLVKTLQRPSFWPQQEHLTKILGFSLLDNHFHLILEEIEEGGVTEFMKRLCTSMTKSFNERYGEKGSLFQGPFKSVTVTSDSQLLRLSVYVMVKNTLEMYPEGGLKGALQDLDTAWDWAIKYPYSSLADHMGERNSLIVEKGVLGEIFKTPELFKDFAFDVMKDYQRDLLTPLGGLTLEEP